MVFEREGWAERGYVEVRVLVVLSWEWFFIVCVCCFVGEMEFATVFVFEGGFRIK